MTHTLGELGVRFGCIVQGDPDTVIDGVGTLAGAEPGQIAFLANARYRRFLDETRASAVILSPEDADGFAAPALLSDDPYLTYARVAALLAPETQQPSGISPAATVDASAGVAADAWIGPGAVVEAGASIGPRCFVGPGSIVGREARLQSHCRLVARVVICHGVSLGERVIVHPGAVLGSDGFGMAREREAWIKVPQLGGLVIGSDVEIGANTTIDRGAIEDTVIGDGVKLDNQIQIGHNVRIGDHTIIAGCTGISGSAVVGRRCMIGGMVGIAGHLEICDDAVITGQTLVSHSVRKPGVYSSALPLDEARKWRRNSARFRQLDTLAKKVQALSRAAGHDDEGEKTDE
ncbi:MAG: UDP-3-O-(3-hydroxymyristoyl)glucosamine N-acyltransferase [Gammaproteobacteria bacterium]|jgi:UDP-3-O-[3-hydroxymyristoyl] glucosamine N-acyltransferase